MYPLNRAHDGAQYAPRARTALRPPAPAPSALRGALATPQRPRALARTDTPAAASAPRWCAPVRFCFQRAAAVVRERPPPLTTLVVAAGSRVSRTPLWRPIGDGCPGWLARNRPPACSVGSYQPAAGQASCFGTSPGGPQRHRLKGPLTWPLGVTWSECTAPSLLPGNVWHGRRRDLVQRWLFLYVACRVTHVPHLTSHRTNLRVRLAVPRSRTAVRAQSARRGRTSPRLAKRPAHVRSAPVVHPCARGRLSHTSERRATPSRSGGSLLAVCPTGTASALPSQTSNSTCIRTRPTPRQKAAVAPPLLTACRSQRTWSIE